MHRYLLVIATLLISSFSFAAPQMSGTPEELRRFLQPNPVTVTLQGSAEKRAYSDTAHVQIKVTTEAKSLEQAMANNRTLRAQLTTSLIKQGLDKEAVKTAKFATSPQYGWFGKRPSSFQVVNQMTVAISDESLMQQLAALIDQHNEVSLDSMTFEHTEEDAAKLEVLSMALDDVMAQKKIYQQELGVTLKVRNIHRNAIARPLMAERVAAAPMTKMASDSASLYESAPQTGFGEVEYQSRVSVEFEVVQP